MTEPPNFAQAAVLILGDLLHYTHFSEGGMLHYTNFSVKFLIHCDSGSPMKTAGAHTIGVTHCDKFVRRIYTFKQRLSWNPPMNLEYLRSLRKVCPINYSPTSIAMLDVSTPRVFDNAYFNNLRYNKGLLASDQVLFTDRRSRPTVNLFAANNTAFQEAFVAAMAKLGRIGLKTGSDGEVRRVCTAVN